MGQPDPGLPEADGRDAPMVGPTVARRLTGIRLKRMRESAGKRQVEVAQALRVTDSKISRMESGEVPISDRDAIDLLGLYGVTDEQTREEVLALARETRGPSWWRRLYADLVPSWFKMYLDLEDAAGVIITYEPSFVPGLLQTSEYAAAVMALSGIMSVEDQRRRVELRMERQDRFKDSVKARPNRRLWALVDEAALRRPTGGLAVLRRQVEYLIELADDEHVALQALPLRQSGNSRLGGPCTLLRFNEPELPDCVYLEQFTTGVLSDKPADTADVWAALSDLGAGALSPADSPAWLERLAGDLQ